MIDEAFVSPTNLRDYAEGHGWTLTPEAQAHRLYVLTHPAFSWRQLVFPMDTTAPDYAEAVERVIEKLSELEQRPPDAIERSILEFGEDVIAFRVLTPRDDELSLPLAFANSLLAGAQQMLLVAANTVLRPRAHYAQLNRKAVQPLLDAARFRHTAPGSFVLNISCPVYALDVEAPNFPGIPFVRGATMSLRNALSDLVTAIENDSLETLIARTERQISPLVSSNLCRALTQFADDRHRYSMDISFRWAAAIPPADGESRVSTVRIPHNYFSRIEDLSKELAAYDHVKYLQLPAQVRSALGPPQDHTFIATVERLNGEMRPDGKRSGEVTLSLVTPEGEHVMARAFLTSDQYEIASRVHMHAGLYARVTGMLHPGPQPRQLSDIRTFELWPPSG